MKTKYKQTGVPLQPVFPEKKSQDDNTMKTFNKNSSRCLLALPPPIGECLLQGHCEAVEPLKHDSPSVTNTSYSLRGPWKEKQFELL